MTSFCVMDNKPNLPEFWCPCSTWIFFMICSKMYRRLHRRIHKWSADHCVGADPLHFVVLRGDQVYVVRTSKFLKVLDVAWWHVQIAREQSCTNWALCRPRNIYSCAGVQVCMCMPHLRAWCVILIRIHRYGLPRTDWIQNWTLCFFFSGLWDKLELSAVRDRLRVFETRFRAGFDFATTRSSSPPCSRSCICLFDMGWGSLIWFLKWLQENMELLMMLNWQRWWFPSSRMQLPSVKMSASWFFAFNVFDLSLWDPSWFCQITNRARLCGFGTRVSSSDSCPE